MKTPSLFYCEYSDTIRQKPENYIICSRQLGIWICNPDLASNKELSIKVFTALFEYENKYEKDALKLISRI